MIGPVDEFPVHQVPQPIAWAGSSDRNFYDRSYFNAHDRTGNIFLVSGIGYYPNLGVKDAFVLVRSADEQTAVHLSDAIDHERLRQHAMVPVNTRGDDHTSLGNQVSSLFVDLPIGEPDDRRRYDKTRAATKALKSGTMALGASTISAITEPVPPVLHERIAEMLFAARLFNITITNIPGPQFPLYALGARLRAILPLVPLAADHALALAILSYDGKLFFGINADRAAMPDLDVVQSALLDEFNALLSLAHGVRARHGRRARDR